MRGKEVTNIYVIVIDTIRLLISVMINPFIDIAHVKYMETIYLRNVSSNTLISIDQFNRISLVNSFKTIDIS